MDHKAQNTGAVLLIADRLSACVLPKGAVLGFPAGARAGLTLMGLCLQGVTRGCNEMTSEDPLTAHML